MALQFITGFDYYDETQVQRVWPYYSNGISVNGRFGGRAWNWNNTAGYLATPIAPASTVIVGMAFFLAYGDATNPILVFQDGTSSFTSPITQVDLRVTNDAAFQVTRNGSPLGTTLSGLFAFGFWNYLEMKVFINDTSGFVQVRLNGQTLLNITGLDTKTSGNNYVNMVRWQPFASSGSFNYKIDDLYICDDTTSFNNNFLGECRVQTQFPTANGERNDFNVFGATHNYEAVSEVIADDDTSYVRDSVLGDIDDYVMGSLALSGAIYGVQVNVTSRKDDVGSRSITPIIKDAGTIYEGNIFACQSDYTVAQKLWEKNPATTAQWTNTTINNLTVGLKIKG